MGQTSNPTAEEITQLRAAIAALESQRPILGDTVVEAALNSMREKLAALESAAHADQQRKLATILFMDITGHTQIIRYLDPEENMAIIDQALARLAEPVAQFGGHIARYQGDGFKAVFGLPTAHEDDPENAVRAGLAIQQTAAQIANELLAERHIENFRVRVGIDTGLIFAGGLTEGEDTVKGMPVNLAARLESAAAPGTILISHNTYRHIRGVFDVQPLEPIQVKGVEGLVQTYTVLQAKPRAFRLATRGVEGVETRMIGRDNELTILKDAYADTMEVAETRIVTIVGEAGVGKSRLLYEFDNWIELRPERILYFKGRATPALQGVAYSLFRDLFNFRFDIRDSDSAAVARDKFCSGMAGILEPERADITGHWLGFDFSASESVGKLLGSTEFGTVAQTHLTRYFRTLARQPTIIFLEDIHWADDNSLDLVTHLATTIPEAQLLIVAVTRPALFERRPRWGEGQSAFQRIPLAPLSRRASRALVDEILQKVEDIPNALRDLIVEAVEGNPFYVEELIKMFIDQGVIVAGEQRSKRLETRDSETSQTESPNLPISQSLISQSPRKGTSVVSSLQSPDDHWHVVTEKLDTVRVPPTLTGLLQARLDGLPRPEREVLQRAAVIGRLFWDDAVAYLSQTARDPIQPTLNAIHQRELIFQRERSAFTGTEEYIFKHALLRDVAYETVLLKNRREFHNRVAHWLENHAGERLGEYVGLIAEHYLQAGENLQAAVYLERSGEEARQAGAFRIARSAFDRALALRQAAGETESPENHALFRSNIRLGEACWHLGDYSTAEAALERGLAGMRQLGDGHMQVQALYWLGRLADSRGDFTRQKELLDESLPLAQAVGGATLSRALEGLARAASRAGELDTAIHFATESLTLARQVGDKVLEFASLNTLGINFRLGPNPNREVSKRYYESCLTLAHETGNLFQEGHTLLNMGDLFYKDGDFAAAKASAQASLDILRELGQEDMIAIALGNLAQAEIKLDERAAARRDAQEALPLAQKLGAIPLVLFAVQVFAEILAAEGNTSRALALLGLVRSHPSTYYEQHQEIDTVLAGLDLNAADLEAGLAAGAALDLDTVVAEILAL